MILLIDGDIVAYRAAAAANGISYRIQGEEFKYRNQAKAYAKENGASEEDIIKLSNPDPVEYALHSVKETIKTIETVCEATLTKVYLTGKQNFRNEVYPLYKANRISVDRPIHLGACREYLIDRFDALIYEGYEADDLLGSTMTKHPNAICASLDKDLMMISGKHYNWVKDEFTEVSQNEADRSFWKQMLTGDATDNIPGIHGIGPVYADRLLPRYLSNKVYYSIIFDTWKNYLGTTSYPEIEETIDIIGKLLWIKRGKKSDWKDLLA